MKYLTFATALISAASLVNQASAWDTEFSWSAGISQSEYKQHMKSYAWVYDKIQTFVERRRPVPDNTPITNPYSAVGSILTCEACQGSFRLAQSLLRDQFLQALTMKFASDVCWLGFRVIDHDACALFAAQSVPAIFDNLASLLISPEYSCQVELGYCNREWYTLDTPETYAQRVLKSKPDYLKNDDFLDFMYEEINTDNQPRKTISIVQFTDLHLDLDYQVGSNKDCRNVLCCRIEDGMATDPANAAGEYGAIGYCDVPVSVLDKMTEKVNELAPDTLFWTGDVVPHDQWNYSQEYVERYQTFLFEYMKSKLNQWATFPLEGNHDFGEVINSQNFDVTDPILPFLAQYWSDYLDEAALKEFSKNGFYTTKFRTTDGTVYENVNVIAINTEACYNANYYLISNREDPGDQLKWLEEKLTTMEANGQTAILIGHHPPASESSLYQWATRFRILIDRFQNVVRLSFFGHVHTEEHNVIKSFYNNKSVGVNYWTGSMSTYTNTYPSFRRFILDAQTMLPVQIETYRFDPENPEFVLDHELSEYYQMPDLSPSSFDDLNERMLNDEQLSLKYLKTKSQQGPKGYESCDEKCRLQVYCDTSTSTYQDSRVCQGFSPVDFRNDPMNAIFITLEEPWYTYKSHPIQ